MNDRQGNNNKTCQTSWCHQKTCGELSVPPSASARICFDHLGSKCPRAWRPLSGEGKGRRINLFVKQWMLQERQTISPLFLFRGFDLTVTSSNVLVLRLRTKTKPRCFRRLLRKSHDTSLPQDPAAVARKQQDELEAAAVLGLAEDRNGWPPFQCLLFKNHKLEIFFRAHPNQKKLSGGISAVAGHVPSVHDVPFGNPGEVRVDFPMNLPTKMDPPRTNLPGFVLAWRCLVLRFGDFPPGSLHRGLSSSHFLRVQIG